MKITSEEVRRIAVLAGLEFDEAGVDQMAAELTKVIDYVDQLRELDLSAIDLDTGGGTAGTPLRADVAGPSISANEVAANAPAWLNEFFVVPQVIGNE